MTTMRVTKGELKALNAQKMAPLAVGDGRRRAFQAGTRLDPPLFRNKPFLRADGEQFDI